MSNPLLQGNYPLDAQPKPGAVETPTLEQEFERSALEKLGGSIAFVKISSGFVWKGPKNEPESR